MHAFRPGFRTLLLAALSLGGFPPGRAWAQVGPAGTGAEPWWVYFDGRPGQDSPALAKPPAGAAPVTERALERRRLRGSLPLTGDWDLPPAPSSLRAVVATGAVIRQTSRWLNAVSVWATPEQRAALATLPGVRELRPVARARRSPEPVTPEPDRPRDPSGAPARLLDYGPSGPQLEEIDVPRLHEAGYDGSGVVVLMLDTGYYQAHQAIPDSQVLAQWDFIHNDGQTANEPGDDGTQHNHGTYTLSALGGSLPGQLYGPAYGASFLLAKTEDVTSETPVEEDHYIAALEWGEALGADLASGSLGYIDWYTPADLDGQTAPTCAAVDQAVALGMVVCVSAGNERTSDWGHLVTPADAQGAIAVGAVTAANALASFSSPGPTADGRIKPEVCARGVATVCAGTNNPTHVRTASGTSLSCPLVAGATALVIQAHPDWTPWQVREALLSTADRADTPDNDFGWGRIRAGLAVEYTRAPEGLVITRVDEGVRLDWQPGQGSGYRVESAPGPAGPWSLLAQTGQTTFLHEGALASGRLCYRVRAVGVELP